MDRSLIEAELEVRFSIISMVGTRYPDSDPAGPPSVPTELLVYTNDEWAERMACGDRFADLMANNVI